MTANDLLQLQQPVTGGAIRSVNFFNGRLLAAKDLAREQDARDTADARLGLALGEGVAWGLEVARDMSVSGATGAVVRIAAGLAINRAGQTLYLAQDTSVALQRQFDSGTDASCTCTFTNCTPLVGGTYVAGAGLYLLTLAPSATTEGRAASNGLDPLNVRCAIDVNVEAVQFRLLQLDAQLLAGLDLGATTLRNDVAYRAFGQGVQPAWFASLFDAPPRADDLIEALRKTRLGDAEVPLALLSFKGISTLDFIDVWAVRRPLHQPETGAFSGLAQSRRLAVGHAMFMQFQGQVTDLANPLVLPASATAQGLCRFLPPVGIIPIAEETGGTDQQALAFFAGMTVRGPAFINAAKLEGLVRESLAYPPIDTQSGEFVWLYRVRENREAIDFAGSTGSVPRSCIVFSSGQMPYRADARFDGAYWNYANYALAR